MNEGTILTTDLTQLHARLSGYRGNYFMSWLLPRWMEDKGKLQHLSVAELVAMYDKEKTAEVTP